MSSPQITRKPTNCAIRKHPTIDNKSTRAFFFQQFNQGCKKCVVSSHLQGQSRQLGHVMASWALLYMVYRIKSTREGVPESVCAHLPREGAPPPKDRKIDAPQLNPSVSKEFHPRTDAYACRLDPQDCQLLEVPPRPRRRLTAVQRPR